MVILPCFRIIFQSTLPRGSDLLTDMTYHDGMLSIHAPSRERLLLLSNLPVMLLFQSTLPRGSDFVPSRLVYDKWVFQSTLPRGSDTADRIPWQSVIAFNPRSLAGATPKAQAAQQIFDFQSTLPRGSDFLNSRKKLKIPFFQSTLPRGSDCAGSRLGGL